MAFFARKRSWLPEGFGRFLLIVWLYLLWLAANKHDQDWVVDARCNWRLSMDRKKIKQVREQVLKKSNEQCVVLRNARVAWQEMLTEREVWDVTLGDGLDGDQPPNQQK